MKVILNLDETTWNVLKPILQDKVINIDCNTQQKESFDDMILCEFDILTLRGGTRILNVLYDGEWPNDFSSCNRSCNRDKKNPHSVVTYGDLLKVTRHEYLRHRNAGIKTWNALSDYIVVFKKEHGML